MEHDQFFKLVQDPSAFRFGEYNLFKLFYVQFFFRQTAQPNSAWKVKPRQNLVWLFLRRLLSLLRAAATVLRLGLLSRKKPRVLFYGATGRLSTIGETTYDLYNARIIEQRGRDQFIIIQDSDDGASKTYRPNFCLNDFSLLIRLLSGLTRLTMGRRLQEYAQLVVNTYPGLNFSRAEIANSVAVFYGNLIVYRCLLTWLAPERVLLTCHYGREPFIAACKSRHIPCIELMHGSMAGSDSFYSYPPSYSHLFSQAIFPDKLAVYGEYWRQIVCQGRMFPENTVVVAGYYLKVPDRPDHLTPHDKTVILITAQPTVQRELCEYIAFLKSRLDRRHWHIVIKPHPREDATAYAGLVEPGFVTLSNQSVYELLIQSDIHISAYSSVLFEAIRYGVCNYALFVDSVASYWNEIVKSGAALALMTDQLPIPCTTSPEAGRLYAADYNPAVLFEHDLPLPKSTL
ncbi:MAG: hypothetical protein JW850_09590 [Thermoflexales bacterium]|nr:hypothetical protein [Thermoflexales bacterium]